MSSYIETAHVPVFHRAQYVTVRGCVTTLDSYIQSPISSQYWDGPAPSHPPHGARGGGSTLRVAFAPQDPPPKCRVGDRVRLNKKHRPFKKGYLPGWTEEVFVVTHVRRHPVVTYRLSEWDGTPIKGTFYEPDVQKVQVSDDSLFRGEKGLKRKGRQVLVRWTGWPAKYDSWIPAQHCPSQNNASKKKKAGAVSR